MFNFPAFHRSTDKTPVLPRLLHQRAHFLRREMLYRQLGLPPQAFRGSSVLEVGPGSGENAWVTASFQPAHYVLLEPDVSHIDQCARLVRGSRATRVDLQPISLDGYRGDAQFDIVLCEGLVPVIDDLYDFLPLLNARVRPGGSLVITCHDSVATLFDTIRRLIAIQIDMPDDPIDTRVARLAVAFGTHVKAMSDMPQSVETWILDTLLAPHWYEAQSEFSVLDAMAYFGREYFFAHSSPQLLSLPTWHPDLLTGPEKFNRSLVEDFHAKRHNLLHHEHVHAARDKARNADLARACARLSNLLAIRCTDTQRIVPLLETIRRNLTDLPVLAGVIAECGALFQARDFRGERIARAYPLFQRAFGRTQQYLCLGKRPSQLH